MILKSGRGIRQPKRASRRQQYALQPDDGHWNGGAARMTTFRLLTGLIRYRPLLYTLNALTWSLIYLAPIWPGMITKLFFDSLSGSSPYKLNITALVVLLL